MDEVVHLALAQARDQDLVPDILPELDEAVALRLDRLAELGEGHAVLGGDVAHGAIQALVVHLDAGLPGRLELDFREHQALQDLAIQDPIGRQLAAALLDLPLDPPHHALELARHHHVVVDDRDDGIERFSTRDHTRHEQ